MKKDIEWLKEEIQKLPVKHYNFNILKHREEYMVDEDEVIRLIDQLDEPETLSQEWIDDESMSVLDTFNRHILAVPVDKLQNLLVPTLSEIETVEITEEQVMEWLDNNDFYCHATAETVLANAVDKGELGYYGTKYSVVKKEPETVEEVVADFGRSLEKLRKIWKNMEVEELEE